MTITSQFLTNNLTFAVDPQKQNFQETSSPAVEPVTRAEAKTFARIVTDSEDALIDGLLVVGRIIAEKYCNRAFVTRDFELFLDSTPMSFVVEFPITPVTAVAKVSTFSEDDTETTFDDTKYRNDFVSKPARVILKEGNTWPTDLRNSSAFRIAFSAGEADAAAVPEPLKVAIKTIFAKLWELRGQIEDGADTGITSIEKLVGRLPIDAVMLMAPFKVHYLE